MTMRFVIIASARTGSSHLVNVLGGHPEIFCHGNVFAQHMMATFWPKGSRPPASEVGAIKSDLRDLRERDPDAFLERVFSTDFGRAHVGFKIFRGQNDPVLEKLVADSSIRKIVLFRRNVLANYSSAMLAKESQVWDVQKGKEQGKPSKVEFEEDQFVIFHNNFIRYYRDVISGLTGSRQSFHLINYEEINDPLMLAATINFIGADGNHIIGSNKMKKIQVKQNTSDILERFSNPDDAEAFLARNNLLHWKHEGEVLIMPIRRGSKSSKGAITSGDEAA